MSDILLSISLLCRFVCELFIFFLIFVTQVIIDVCNTCFADNIK